MIKHIKYFIKVEPYWNVKLKNHTRQEHWRAIKVEPYWNVKMKYSALEILSENIKVEPYWNVKIRVPGGTVGGI